MSIPHEVSHQPGPKISSQINRIAGFPAQRGANSKDQEEQTQWHHIPCTQIRIILQRKNHKHKHRTRHNLGENLARLGQERLRIRAEHACGSCVREARHSPDSSASFVCVDGGLVIAVDDGRGAEAAEDLGGGVDGELVPGEFPVQAVDECDGRVEVATCAAGDLEVLIRLGGFRWDK